MSGAWLLLLLLASPAPAELESPPFTVIFTPPYRAEAERIAAELPAIVERQVRLLGSPPLEPAELHLLSDTSGEERPGHEGIPSWAAGVALPHENRILIWPDRIGRYTQRHLLSVVAHETAHMIAHHAAGNGAHRMPRWFREGVASNLAREGEWLDFFYLWASPISSSDRPLEDLSASFGTGGSGLTRAAYAGSYSFVRFIEEKHSASLPSSLLAGLRAGLGFETAYARAAGVPLRVDEQAWAASMRGRSRWVAIITSSFTLWATITLLATLAYLRKRRRTRQTMERWAEEDPFD